MCKLKDAVSYEKDKLNQKGTKFSIPYETSDTDTKTEVKESEIHMKVSM